MHLYDVGHATEGQKRIPRQGLRAELTLKQKRGLMHDRFVLLKRECALNDEERLNLDGWTKNYPAQPKFERKRAPEPVEIGRALPDDAMGYGLPVLEKVRALKPPKEADQHKAPPLPKNYGADISTLIRMIEAGEL